MRLVDQHDLAVGAADVLGQRRAAAGGVEADDHVAADRGTAEQERELRHVVEQQPDMRRAIGIQQLVEHGRAHDRLTDDAVPGPLAVLEEQSWTAYAELGEQLLANRHGQTGSAASARPIVSDCSVAPPNRNSKRLAVVK